MTNNLQNPRLIERQHRMMGLGLSPAMILEMMDAPVEKLEKSIADGKSVMAGLEGDDLDRAAKLVRAFETELEIRAAE